MHKKSARVSLKIKKGDTVHVKKGDKITRGDTLLSEKNVELSEFNLSQLLGVKPHDVPKFLVVSEDDVVVQGAVIAQKSNLFGKKIIKTPLSGKFIWVDKDTGRVGIHEDQEGEIVKAYFDGVVEDISEAEIIFLINGQLISAKDGKGRTVTGKLLVLTPETEAITMPIDVAETILAIKVAHPELIAKADALGAVGVIAETIEAPAFSLPYVLVDDMKSFASHHGMTIILYGDKKELLILDEK